jgi:Protein of unknown function (DUF3253)
MIETIEAAIVELLRQRAPTSSICPSDVARRLHPHDEAAWRALMPQVREAAGTLRDKGLVRITRSGEDVAPQDLHHGAIRLKRGKAFDTSV